MAFECSESRSPHVDGADLRQWQELPTSDLPPFVHRFETQRQKYVFDVNTRRIIRVSAAVWDVLEDYGSLADQDILVKHSEAHGPDGVRRALSQIARGRERQGIFLSFRPKEILAPPRERILRSLEQEREQLILNVTEDCNFRCSYCVFGGGYRHHRTHSTKAMEWNIARRAVDEFMIHSKLSESRVISFYGGEPLLNLPLIRKCVAHVKNGYKQLPVQFAVTTNGSLIAGEVAALLGREGFLIQVSLDGPPDIHDRCRRTRAGSPTWEQIVSNIEEFLAAFPAYRTNGLLQFNAVATPSTNLCDVQRFWETWEIAGDSMGLEVSEQRQACGQPLFPLPGSPLAVSKRRLFEKLIAALKDGTFGAERGCKSRWVQAAIFEKPLVAFHKRGYVSPHLPEEMIFSSTCIPGGRRTFASVDGRYFACERVIPSEEQLIGDVATGVQASRVVALLERWTEASRQACRRCWCLSHCNMGCFATVGEDGRVTEQAKGHACALYRRGMHYLLTVYCGILEQNPRAFEYTLAMELH